MPTLVFSRYQPNAHPFPRSPGLPKVLIGYQVVGTTHITRIGQNSLSQRGKHRAGCLVCPTASVIWVLILDELHAPPQILCGPLGFVRLTSPSIKPSIVTPRAVSLWYKCVD
jgi:hypothetical protein